MSGKNIVICCDGTGNEYGVNNTNVVGLFKKIKRDEHQIGFYDPGVGTFDIFGFAVGRLAKKIGIWWGLAFGTGMVQNVEDAYEYLMDKYEPGDKVFIFGFSRGAFTARVLAGMLNKCGLLQKGSNNLIPYASRINFTSNNQEAAEGFKRAFSHECKPRFLGVWDTVASLGHVHALREFCDDHLNLDVANAYHAISIDEQRKKFPVSLWDESKIPEHQTIVQVWFTGVHSDVGGYYKERGLSDITLEWMLTQAQKQGLDLECKRDTEQSWRASLNRDYRSEIHESRKTFWKLWPVVHRKIPSVSAIFPKGALIHQSVIDRMNDKNTKKYSPRLPADHTVVDHKYLERN